MKTYFVYMLHCSDGTYYTGVTNDINRRVYEHHSGYNAKAYTHSRRPLKLVYVNRFNSILQAIAFEKQLKKWSQAKKEALIAEEYETLVRLAKKQFSVRPSDYPN